MSKRFGRNQRRKMREELVEQAREAAYAKRELNKARDELGAALSRVARWAEDIMHLAGPDSAFNLELRRFSVKNLVSLGPFLRLAPISPIKMAAFSDAPPSLQHPVHVIEAAVYLAQIDQSFVDRMRGMVRIRLLSAGGDIGYAFNIDLHQSLSPRDIAGIAEMIASALAKFARAA